MVNEDGSLYTENLRTARQSDEFTTSGGPQILEPRFTLHGFRYAEVTGGPGELDASDVTARVVHSDIAKTGAFSSSETWLNQLFRNIDWAQRGNFISVPTDCSQRDERLGWLADAQIFARTACYNRDVAAFFSKWLDDVADAQLPSGAFTDVAPRLDMDQVGLRLGRRRGDRPMDGVEDVRGYRCAATALRVDDRLDGFPGTRQPGLPEVPGTR